MIKSDARKDVIDHLASDILFSFIVLGIIAWYQKLPILEAIFLVQGGSILYAITKAYILYSKLLKRGDVKSSDKYSYFENLIVKDFSIAHLVFGGCAITIIFIICFIAIGFVS